MTRHYLVTAYKIGGSMGKTESWVCHVDDVLTTQEVYDIQFAWLSSQNCMPEELTVTELSTGVPDETPFSVS